MEPGSLKYKRAISLDTTFNKQLMTYVFDIDGTLTPSRLKMDKGFQEWFFCFMESNKVWLVTGSDKDKTIEQIGEEMWTKVDRVYQCSGNVLYINGVEKRRNDFDLPDYYEEKLNMLLNKSPYPVRAGNHIEKRQGLVNFSIVGRDCTQEQRDAYGKWDDKNKEREDISWELNSRYPWIEVVKGGQISVDIYEEGKNKAQILDDLEGNYVFFGDHMQPGGNDYPVFKRAEELGKLKDNRYIEVNGWEQTFNHLKSIWNK